MDGPMPSFLVEILDIPGIRGWMDETVPPDGHSGVRHLRHRQFRDHRPLRSAPRGVVAHLPGLPHGISLHDTPGWVCARLDATGFEEGFRDWVQDAFELTED